MEARIDRLPESFRTVFMLLAVQDLSALEVAAALDLPEATVRTRFFRARALLREGLSRDVDLALGDAFDGARCDRMVAGMLARRAAEGAPVSVRQRTDRPSVRALHRLAAPCGRGPRNRS